MVEVYPLSQLHVEQHGSGPRVVFVHGGEEAGGAFAFAAQLPLAQRFTLIWPDLPGHGKSPAQGHKTVDRDASIVAELLGDGAHLVGHSFGGAVALHAAASRPDKVHSLTLIEPATLDIAAHDPAVREMLMEVAAATQLPDLRERVLAVAKAVGIKKNWPETLSDTYRKLAEALPSAQVPTGTETIPSRQYAAQVAAANIPALVISGGHRQSWEITCDALAQALHGERAVIPGYYHQPQQSGEAFNACVEAFWTRHLR